MLEHFFHSDLHLASHLGFPIRKRALWKLGQDFSMAAILDFLLVLDMVDVRFPNKEICVHTQLYFKDN